MLQHCGPARRLARDRWGRLVRSRAGQALVEYVVLIALLAVGCVLSLTSVGEALMPAFEQVTQHLDGASAGSGDAEEDGSDNEGDGDG